MALFGQLQKTITLFFSSPGDVDAERSRLIRVVEELNPSFARHGITLKHWSFKDHAVPAVAPPGCSVQTVIDMQMPREPDGSIAYDLFVGIMDRRIGTPLKDAPSGTVHEFLEARQSFEAKGTPHVLFYFRSREPNGDPPDPQTEGVLRFRSQYPGLSGSYTSIEDIETQFRRHLLTELLDLLRPGTPHEPDPVPGDSWDRMTAAYASIRAGYPPTFLDNSPERVGRILRQLHLLFGSEHQLQPRERKVLAAVLLSLLLNEADRLTFETAAGGADGIAGDIRDAVARSLDRKMLAIRPVGTTRLDLIGALAMIGLRLDLTRHAIAVGASAPAATSDDWLALLTEDIVCERGIVRHHLVAPSIEWAEPLRSATALALEAVWQNSRTVLTRYGFSFAVSQSRVEVDAEPGAAPPVALGLIANSAKQAAEALPRLPHFGETRLPSLEALLPLPSSMVRAPVTFRAPMPGPVRLRVNGAVVAAESDSGVIEYYPPPGDAVNCVLECDEAGEFIPVIVASLQRLSPVEAGIFDAAGCASDALRSLRLWNDLLESIWPGVSGKKPDNESLAAAYHVLRNAFDETAAARDALLKRHDTYWDAMEIIRKRLVEVQDEVTTVTTERRKR